MISRNVLAAGLFTASVLVAAGGTATAAAAGSSGSRSTAAPAAAVGSGTLGCAQLEALWRAAGGSSGEELMAAKIAMAESGGRQYATDADGNGTVDKGYWQINTVHGALATYNALGNAKAAVIISVNGTDWGPWVTYQTGAYEDEC